MVEIQSELEERVSEALLDDERTSEAEISVEEDDGVITLVGTVEDMETREAAEDIIRQVEGVLEVISDIELAEDEDEETGGVAGITTPPPNQ